MDINDGRFTLNGGCGYVLKPSIMRDEVSWPGFHIHCEPLLSR